ncbi:MAG: DNRLRE domain-containing protein [Byssovorax sp.]
MASKRTMVGSTGRSAGERRIGAAGWAAMALLSALAMGAGGAAGCGDTLDSRGETAGERETTAEARQADSTPITCVTLRRGTVKAFDAMISSEKAANNYGASTLALTGASTTGPNDRFYALFKFDVSSIPANATITSANAAFSQTNNGVASWNAHLITAPWDEATVTWQSFASAFNPVTFKSASTATASVVFSVAPQVQGWVSGNLPNHGLLIEQPGSSQSQIKTQEFLVVGSRPTITACYKVTCAANFADCNGVAADGCEADLHSTATCGSCGTPCALPHATASCATGACAVGSCDLGWGDCDGNPQNGCETDLTSTANCGACGVACALPNAAVSCAGGSCKALSCNAGSFDCDGSLADGCEPLPCGNGSHCASAGDCASHVCAAGFCASPICSDHAQNGSETDVDCGGSCPPCADGGSCGGAADCQSSVCAGGACQPATCADGVKNGNESGADCGGSCAKCADGSGCTIAADCQSGVCLGGACQAPGCTDSVKNGSETGIDCGGSCGPCANGTGCAIAADCQSGVCAGNVCQIPSCADGVKNGSESDVDCGGSCADCNDNQTCQNPGDCTNGVCTAGHCQPATCSDGVKNGNETGIDCGGACTIPEVCNGVDDDCNGSVDEGLGSTTCGIGACQVTVPNCANGQAQSCVPGAPVAEACDGVLDDDCDGTVDNGCDCVNGATQGCYTGSAQTLGVGVCHGGTQTCVLGHWGACQGEVKPGAESCNGLDDDCDGQVDEDLGSTICGVGACQVMVQNCVNGKAQSCAPGAPGAEICDGIDNNCDGQVDENMPTVSCGAGACQVTVPSCVNGAPQACNPHLSDGLSCNDGHDCTQNDACSNGACAGQNKPAGTVCRASAGACDAAETCTGSAPDCPADGKLAAGTVCRASTGACDPAETCNGSSNTCPADAISAAGTICRPSAGACDPAEACNGVSAACPADTLSAAGTVCRASGGVCDVQETCTGSAAACPADTKIAAGTTCRASAGTCDVAESCDGSNSACPADGFVAAGTKVGACVTGLSGVCSAGNNTCSGSGASPSCVQTTASSAEVCDGLDNNCNGSVDDGLSCAAVTYTNASWKQTQNPAAGWQNTVFDDSTWANAVDEGAPPIAPWGAVAMPSWSAAHWIWPYDSKSSADTFTVYFRKSFVPSSSSATLRITADNSFNVYVNGSLVGSGNNYTTVYSFNIALNAGQTNVIAVQAINAGGQGGLLADISNTDVTSSLVSDTSWKQIQNAPAGWQNLAFVDSSWLAAVDEAAPPTSPWGGMALPSGSTAHWIWSYDSRGSGDNQTVYFRKKFTATKNSYTLYVTADNSFTAYLNGSVVGSGNNWPTVYSFGVATTAGSQYVLAVAAANAGGPGGLLLDLR